MIVAIAHALLIAAVLLACFVMGRLLATLRRNLAVLDAIEKRWTEDEEVTDDAE